MKKTHYRTLWLSDIHLGNRDCKAEYLLSFLNSITVDTLYLVGDIVDMWQMTKQFRWPQAHNQVMHKFMQMSQDGTRVVYLPGNHDEPIQSYSGMAFGDIEIERELVHTTAQGKRYLVLHGDQFDGDVTMGKFHAWIGDKGYDLLLFLNREFNRLSENTGHLRAILKNTLKERMKPSPVIEKHAAGAPMKWGSTVLCVAIFITLKAALKTAFTTLMMGTG